MSIFHIKLHLALDSTLQPFFSTKQKQSTVDGVDIDYTAISINSRDSTGFDYSKKKKKGAFYVNSNYTL
jgi:hypothetical protein